MNEYHEGKLYKRLEEAEALVEKKQQRIDELLQSLVRLTRETPYAEELEGLPERVGKLVAEVGTQKAKVAQIESLWTSACEIARTHCPVEVGRSHIHDGIPRLAAKLAEEQSGAKLLREALLRLVECEHVIRRSDILLARRALATSAGRVEAAAPVVQHRGAPARAELVWAEDDATVRDPDHETLGAAWKRLYGEDFYSVEYLATKTDHGDGDEYVFPDGRIAWCSYPGGCEIRQKRAP